MESKCSPEEWRARVDLAACCRLIELYGMSDMMANHVSARVPGEPGAFLLNPYGVLYEEITASSLVKVDLDGAVLAKPDFGALDYGINKAGYVLHSAIHGARHEVDCVIHTHTWANMAVSALDCGLLPMTQTAMRFAKVAYHDYEGVVLEMDERERLLKNLGDCEVMLLRNHGTLAVGRTVAEAFNNAYRLERACRTQLLAQACNDEVLLPSKEVFEKTARMYQPGVRRTMGLLEWPAMRRLADRLDPSYKN
jgi:ribulose-5-phosphate 4-epimerase/fuculose-1-phosphate aldolase